MSKPAPEVTPSTRRKSPRASRTSREQQQRSTRRRPGNGGKILGPSEEKTQLFFSALRTDDVDTARGLLDSRQVYVNGHDVDDVTLPTPLLVACEKQFHEIIHVLLTTGHPRANVNLESSTGKRPIWWAARYGDHEMARLLLDTKHQQCEVNYLDTESGCTPLYRAILSNSTEVCAALIHAGADVNLRCLGTSGVPTAETPLMRAVQLNNLAVVDMLVNSMCDLNAHTATGLTALHYAVGYQRYDVTQKLLANNIRIGAKSTHGITAMTVAIAQNSDAAMVHLLVTHGYNPDLKFDWGETPLEVAIKKHNENCALALVYDGCSLRVEAGKPSYFLQAVNEGLVKLVKVLLAINGRYISEEWLWHGHMPLALYKHPQYYKKLLSQASNPLPLQDICRSVILGSVGRFPIKKAGKLPLPRKLKDFVKLKKDFPKNLFAESSIYDNICPYDCPYFCSQTQCIDLDFSSSGEEDIDIL